MHTSAIWLSGEIFQKHIELATPDWKIQYDLTWRNELHLCSGLRWQNLITLHSCRESTGTLSSAGVLQANTAACYCLCTNLGLCIVSPIRFKISHSVSSFLVGLTEPTLLMKMPAECDQGFFFGGGSKVTLQCR